MAQDDDNPTWHIMAVGLILLCILMMYIVHKNAIHKAVCLFEMGLLYPFTFFSDKAVRYYSTLGSIGKDAFKDLTLAQVWGIHSQVFYAFWMWFCMPVSAWCFYRVWRMELGRKNCTRFDREIGPLTLMRENVKLFPCIAPAVQVAPGKWRKTEKNKWGKTILHGCILDKPYDKGSWRVARSPVQFLVENQILIDCKTKKPIEAPQILVDSGTINKKSPLFKTPENQCLDAARLQKVFLAQLGPEFGDPQQDWRDYEKALAGVFLLFAKAKKARAYDLLNKMSLSYWENPDDDSECGIKVPREAIKAFDEMFPAMRNHVELCCHEVFRYPWLMAALNLARTKGVLPAFYFLWLRPIDRQLWYALEQVGGREPYPEAMGTWSHWRAERVAQKSIGTPFLQPAIDGMMSYSADYLQLTSPRKGARHGQ